MSDSLVDNNFLNESVIGIISEDTNTQKRILKHLLLDIWDKSYNIILKYNKDSNIEEIANQLKELQQGMMKFYGEIEKGNAQKKTSYNIVIILEDYDIIMENEHYKSIDTIKCAVGSIARLGKYVGIQIIYTSSTDSTDDIGDLKLNTTKSIENIF